MRSTLATIALFSLIACGGQTEGNKTTSGSGKSPGASTEASSQDIGEVLATVDGSPIGSTEFETNAARKAPADGNTLSLDEKQEVLDRMVNEQLLYQAALAKGLDKDPKVQKVMVNTLLREVVYASVRNSDFTDEELQAYYESHKDEFIVPEKVQIKRILVKVKEDRPDAEAKAEAERIRGEVVASPDKFKELAAKYSEDPYRRRGGDVGFVSKEGKPGLDPEVVSKAFEMKVDEVSEVFKTSEGYNIVLLATRREQVERTFQQMKGSVLRKVKNDKLKTLHDDYVTQLRQAANIQVNQDKLELLDVSGVRRPGAGGVNPLQAGDDEDMGMDEMDYEGDVPSKARIAPPDPMGDDGDVGVEGE